VSFRFPLREPAAELGVRWQSLPDGQDLMHPEGDVDPAIARFIQEVEAVPWFNNVGQRLPAETNARQIHRWEDWPGPEEPAIFELSERQQVLHDELLASAPERRKELHNLWKRLNEIVISLAAKAVPYDANKDSWHGPNMAVWQASWTAGLVAWCLLLRRRVPAELQEQWRWFVLGHWPSGYSVVWADDRLGPLLVL
jgi:hypothetical protein